MDLKKITKNNSVQNLGIRAALRALLSTPVRNLEFSSEIPPLDIRNRPFEFQDHH